MNRRVKLLDIDGFKCVEISGFFVVLRPKPQVKLCFK